MTHQLFHIYFSHLLYMFYFFVLYLLYTFLRAISPLHLPTCLIPSTPSPVLDLPCNPYKCHKISLSLLFSPEEAKWALCEYVIVHTILGGSSVILWISLGGKPKWLPLKFGYHDVMRTSPIGEMSRKKKK